MTVYIDTNSYGALKKNINGSEPNFDPYFIDETTINFFGRDNKQVTIFQKTGERRVEVVKAILSLEDSSDDQIIRKLNENLNHDSKKDNKEINDFKDFLEKKEKTEESQESKPNSEIVEEGDKYKYETKNGEIKEGVISNTKGVDGESVNNVNLKEKILQGGKRKSKKSKKSKKTKKSKKSKTRKNSRKTNRRR